MSDIVRVLRILEYVGPREWVENTLRMGAVPANGVHEFVSTEGVPHTIKSALVDPFPEVVKEAKTDDAEAVPGQ